MKLSSRLWEKIFIALTVVSFVYLVFAVFPPTAMFGVCCGLIALAINAGCWYVAHRRAKLEEK